MSVPLARAAVSDRLGWAMISAKGFCMGAADVVPGVSGGTMAFILGIYERLLRAIRAFDLQLLGLVVRFDVPRVIAHVDLGFLTALGAGIVAALFVFTRVIPLPQLIHTDPVPVFSVFFGLVAASIVVLLRHVRQATGGLGLAEVALLGAGTALGWGVVNLVPTETPETSWFLFVSGALAICAMILPGISGSFILLVLRKYAYVFDAIGRLDLSVLVPFALGAACGLMVFTRFLLWLLRRFRTETLVTIIGILVGSLWLIWPFQDRVYETVRGKERLVSATPVAPWDSPEPVGLAVVWMLVGLGAVLAVEYLPRRRSGDVPD
jgi:putative membrane protein